MSEHDAVNHPKHYTSHPSGVECIQVTEHMSFNLGNAVKYIWRADLKADALEDLKKAEWYIQREIAKRTPQVPTRIVAADDGWIAWEGGDCPVSYGTRVEFRLHSGFATAGSDRLAGILRWEHTAEADDIVAYRVVSADSAKAQK